MTGRRGLPDDLALLDRDPVILAPRPVDLPGDVLVVPDTAGEQVDPAAAMAELGSLGIVDLLVEGGPKSGGNAVVGRAGGSIGGLPRGAPRRRRGSSRLRRGSRDLGGRPPHPDHLGHTGGARYQGGGVAEREHLIWATPRQRRVNTLTEMFTGIVGQLGEVELVERGPGSLRLRIDSRPDR